MRHNHPNGPRHNKTGPAVPENNGARVRYRVSYSAFSSSVTAPTDFLASPNSMEVWSA